MKKLKQALLVSVLGLGMHNVAMSSDAAVGLGLSYVFGEGAALGLKVFSDDEPYEVVGSVGVKICSHRKRCDRRLVRRTSATTIT